MSSQVSQLEGVEFRQQAAVTEQEKAAIKSEVIDFVERYLAIEDVLGETDKPSAFDAVSAQEIDSVEDAEEVAKTIRKDWDLGDDPIPSVTSLLEQRNVRVFVINGADRFFGLTCRVRRSNDLPPVPVVVRRRVNVERDRFTTAHEIAHAYIASCKDGKLEKAVDRCAAAFLVPAEHLIGELGRHRTAIGYAELVGLKRIYGVSMWALMRRLADHGVIQPSDLRNMYRNERTRGWLKSEPEPLDPDGDLADLEKPKQFESLVSRALAEGLIRPNRAAELLGKRVADADRIAWGPEAH